MGTQLSKPAKTAARKFPTRAPGSAVPPPSSSVPRSQPPGNAAAASLQNDDAIRADALDPSSSFPNPVGPNVDPSFAQRLQKMGIVTPNPTHSANSPIVPPSKLRSTSRAAPPPTSLRDVTQQQLRYPDPTNNTTLTTLEARKKIRERAEVELENLTVAGGKEFASAATMRRVLEMRARGENGSNIEERFRLRQGFVDGLGPRGLVELVG